MHSIKKDINHCNRDSILFAKQPYNTKNEAVIALNERHLKPGELAAVRYYVSESSTRMLLGCGGIDPKTGNNTFVFEDNGSTFTTTFKNNLITLNGIDAAIEFILQNLIDIDTSNLVTKEYLQKEINSIYTNIEADVKNIILEQDIPTQVDEAIEAALKEIDINNIDGDEIDDNWSSSD